MQARGSTKRGCAALAIDVSKYCLQLSVPSNNDLLYVFEPFCACLLQVSVSNGVGRCFQGMSCDIKRRWIQTCWVASYAENRRYLGPRSYGKAEPLGHDRIKASNTPL